MKLKQISVFLENKKGHLLEVLNVLSKAKINIRALSIADTSDFGILRLILPDPDKAAKILSQNKITVKETEVIAVGVSDKPGGLAEALQALNSANLNLEYMYAFVAKSKEKAVVVFRTENINAGIKALKKAGIPMLKAEEIYRI
ncbi:MAG: acetolactate synthase [Nitrospirae bacterium]|nr:acetolactate synthase [Nitrospirota bacterium]